MHKHICSHRVNQNRVEKDDMSKDFNNKPQIHKYTHALFIELNKVHLYTEVKTLIIKSNQNFHSMHFMYWLVAGDINKEK